METAKQNRFYCYDNDDYDYINSLNKTELEIYCKSLKEYYNWLDSKGEKNNASN